MWTVPVLGSGFTNCVAVAHNLCENDTYRSPAGSWEKTGMSQTEGQVGRSRDPCSDKVCSKEINSEVHINGYKSKKCSNSNCVCFIRCDGILDTN